MRSFQYPFPLALSQLEGVPLSLDRVGACARPSAHRHDRAREAGRPHLGDQHRPGSVPLRHNVFTAGALGCRDVAASRRTLVVVSRGGGVAHPGRPRPASRNDALGLQMGRGRGDAIGGCLSSAQPRHPTSSQPPAPPAPPRRGRRSTAPSSCCWSRPSTPIPDGIRQQRRRPQRRGPRAAPRPSRALVSVVVRRRDGRRRGSRGTGGRGGGR